MSRSVAREAIRVLESMGMVASRRRVGITIQPAQNWNVFDPQLIRWRLEAGDRAAQLVSLSELRGGFEPAAAALAARRADPQQCRIMAAAVSDMVVHGRSGDLDAYLFAVNRGDGQYERPGCLAGDDGAVDRLAGPALEVVVAACRVRPLPGLRLE